MTARRVVVTGLGLVSPLGVGPAAHRDGWRSGRSFTGPISLLAPGPLPFGAAGEVPADFRAGDYVDNKKNLKLMTRAVRLGVAGAHMAVTHAGLVAGDDAAAGQTDPVRFACFVGAPHAHGEAADLLPALEASTTSGAFDLGAFGREGLPRVHPLWLLKGLSNNVLGLVSPRYRAMGPNANLAGSGAGGAQAIGEGLRAIREARADVALCGGYDSIVHVEGLSGYGRLGVLATTRRHGPAEAGRPFDRDREGFVPSEGACFLVLEELERAVRRGAAVHGEVLGAGDAMDAHDLAAPEPTGRGLVLAARAALRSAGLAPADVAFVVAHASGSVAFDPVEAAAIAAVLGPDHAGAAYVTAPKGALGHTIAASGAFGAAAALLAFEAGAVPPTANLDAPDPACAGLRHVRSAPAPLPPAARAALVHAVGLGGQTTALLVGPAPA